MNTDRAHSQTDVEALIERMSLVRSNGYDHAIELQGEASRLIDWTEYVRAKPLASVAVASLLGFGIVRSTMRMVSEPSAPISTDRSFPVATKRMNSSLLSGFGALATSIATAAVKNYFTTLVQRNTSEESSDDRFRKFRSKEQNVS